MPEIEALLATRRADVWVGRGEAGGLLARRCLSHYLGAAPASLAFARGAHGKPELADPAAPLAFNLSHSGDCCVVAVCDRRYAVGVDVELLRQREFLRLARRFFAEAEADSLRRLPVAERMLGFYRHWTLKEAWLKARGSGLRKPLRSVSFRLRDDAAIAARGERGAPALDCMSGTLPGGCLALALGGRGPAQVFCRDARPERFGAQFPVESALATPGLTMGARRG